MHDFVGKLKQPDFLPRIVDYVAWQKARRAAREAGADEPKMPSWAPLSINLDLTTACNFACDHCIDWDILNSGIGFEHDRLLASLGTMADHGLRSVILIGGGEPTVYPKFRETVRFLKARGLQVAVVTNGSRMDRILDVADCLDEHDWVRLSLDSGTDDTFQRMHKPKTPVTLESICAGVPPIKAVNPKPRIGFSYIIVWDGAERGAGAPPVVENLEEIPRATRLALEHGFDYIAFKPFLTRAADGAEVMDPQAASASLERVTSRIRTLVDEAKDLATDGLQVVESTNLKLLEDGDWRAWTRQPQTCHMQVLRQVLSPLGLWNCPAHRGIEKARITGRNAFEDDRQAAGTAGRITEMLDGFDASKECREVTCLYHAANWWIEQAIEDPRGLADVVGVDGADHFL